MINLIDIIKYFCTHLKDFGTVPIISVIVICIIEIIAYWKIYEKAGYLGFRSIIPFYNSYIFCKFILGNGLLFLIPLAAFIPAIGGIIATVFWIYLQYKFSKAFGHGIGYAIGLILLPTIFVIIIGFGKSKYQYENPDKEIIID